MSETFEQWRHRLLYLLVGQHGLALPVAEEVVAECAAHCAETGEAPEAAFGSPEAFAARTAAARIPVRERAERDRDGNVTGDYAWGATVRVGVLLVLATAVAWAATGGWLALTVAGVGGCVVLAGALVLAGLTKDLFRAGRLRAARLAAVAVAALVPLTAVVFVAGPRARLAEVPTVSLALAGVLAVVVAWRTDGLWRAVVRTPRPGGGGADLASERWLTRLDGVLRGRHEWSSRRAGQFVAETRAHLAATGGRAEDEFGPVEVYALRVAEQVRAPRRWWRGELARTAVIAAALLWLLLLRVADGDFGVMFALNAVVLLAVLANLCRRLVRRLPAQTGA
ncbi:MAG TPA: hypothetical protein VES42_14455 [Pilimelia sp.]|nr:hypothetical protein [Pilimelia sp.]